MLTRSHSASTSARMWLDSSTVRPSRDLADVLLEDRLHQRVEARRSALEDEQLDVDASAATSATFCRLPLEYVRAFLQVEVEALKQVGRGGLVQPPRSRPSRSMTSPR